MHRSHLATLCPAEAAHPPVPSPAAPGDGEHALGWGALARTTLLALASVLCAVVLPAALGAGRSLAAGGCCTGLGWGAAHASGSSPVALRQHRALALHAAWRDRRRCASLASRPSRFPSPPLPARPLQACPCLGTAALLWPIRCTSQPPPPACCCRTCWRPPARRAAAAPPAAAWALRYSSRPCAPP